MNTERLVTAALVVILAALSSACRTTGPQPDYGRPLPPGAPALLPLQPGEPRPDLASQWTRRDELLEVAERSLRWFDKPSSETHFPLEGVSHARARGSVERFREILLEASSAEDFERRVEREFTVYKSAGWDGEGGGVLFTGYCTPILDGSATRTSEYRWPLYGLPDDLVKAPDGSILGQRTGDGTRPYPDRRAIESRGLLDGQGLELVWMRSPLDAYIAHVNGSTIVRMRDGGLKRFGYAGKNGLQYTSLRGELVRDGKLTREEANLETIRRWARAHPAEVEEYLWRNPSYVFFMPIDGNPRGSLNVEVTPERTLATDKALFPRAAIVYVDASLGRAGVGKPFSTFMFDQDTGGAIRTAGRADIYLGRGARAERMAGATQSEGQLYYLFLKG